MSLSNNLSTYSKRTDLLVLPNELLEIIFEYLSSVDLVRSIFLLNNSRLNSLIYRFISRIDLTKFRSKSFESISMLVSFIRLDSKQIHLIRLHPALRSLIIVQTDPTDVDFLSFLPKLSCHLNSLSLHLDKNSNIKNFFVARHLFQRHYSLETLNFQSNQTPINFELGHIASCPTMKRLTLAIAIYDDLFILCEYLPCLEYLEILSSTIRVNYSNANRDKYVLQKPVSKYLSNLKMTAYIYFDLVEQFIQLFSSSLEYLTLSLHIWSEPIDGHRLVKHLINKCAKLEKFNFYFTFYSIVNQSLTIDFESFQPAPGNYWSTHPVVYIDQPIATIASLPLTESQFLGFGNDFPNKIHFNCIDPPPFTRIRQVELTGCDGPLSLRLFKFIEQFFTHVEELSISRYCYLADFDWTLLPCFPRVKTLTMYKYNSVNNEINPPNATSLCAYFSLVPNVRRWRTSIQFLKEYQIVLRTDQQLRNVLEHIEEVQIRPMNNKQSKELIQSLFPNAFVSFDLSIDNMYSNY